MPEGCGQLDARLTVGADTDRLVAVALAGLPVRLTEPALGLPAPAPLRLREPGLVQVVPGAGQLLTAAHDVRESGLAVGPCCGQPVLKHPQPPGLRMPLAPRAVTPGRLLRPLLPDRLGQSVLDGADARFQVLDVGQLAAAGQRPLVVRRLGDRPGPARRRQRRQLPLASRPRPVTAPNEQHSQKVTHSTRERQFPAETDTTADAHDTTPTTGTHYRSPEHP